MEKQSLELTLVFDNLVDMTSTMKYVKRMDNKGSIMGGYHGKCLVKFCENTLALMSDEMYDGWHLNEKYENAREKRKERI